MVLVLHQRSLWVLGTLALAMSFVNMTGGKVGCFAQDAGPTYHKDILPILQSHCLVCHHKGGSAPQAMESYKEMRPWIRASKKQIAEKTMPPWHADRSVGKWKNEPNLTPDEVRKFTIWADAKGPEGDAKDAPKPIDYSQPWKLGTPDRILAAPAFEVPEQGGDIYKSFVLSPEFAEDTWIGGIELSPGAVEAVQQMSASLVPGASAKTAEEAPAYEGIQAPGAKNDLAVWNKGLSLYELLPTGAGILAPEGSVLRLRIHYKTLGEAMKDESKVGLYLAKGTPGKELKTAALENRSFEIPADAAAHQLTADLKLEKGVKILSLLPQMHYLGKKIEISATLPGGEKKPILKIEDYSYDLQTLYTAAEPIALPAGTKLEASATYDNSRDNTSNPNMAIKKAAPGPAPLGEILSVGIQYIEE